MPNPTLGNHHIGYDEHDVVCEGVVINGLKVLTDRQANVADAVVAHAIADAGADLAAALETELEGFLDALGVQINLILDVLEEHGLMTAT